VPGEKVGEELKEGSLLAEEVSEAGDGVLGVLDELRLGSVSDVLQPIDRSGREGARTRAKEETPDEDEARRQYDMLSYTSRRTIVFRPG
jgi:hypothetical protein